MIRTHTIMVLLAHSAAAGCAHSLESPKLEITRFDDGEYINVEHGELTSPSLIVRDTRENSGRDLLLIGLHGYGMDERQIATLLNIDPGTPHVYIAPRGFVELDSHSRAWFDIQFEGHGIAVDTVVRRQFLDRLMDYLDGLSEFFGIDRDRVVVIGYSQGAAGVIDLAISHPDRAAAFVGLAGTVLEPSLPANSAAYENSVLFIGHGLRDTAVTVTEMSRHVDRLQDAGMQIEYREYDMPHVVSTVQRRDVSEWIALRLGTDESEAEASKASGGD